MLLLTGVELELISDPEIHDFVNRGLRGGVSVITKQYVEGDTDLENGKMGTKILYIE